jgi:hypothetical protein
MPLSDCPASASLALVSQTWMKIAFASINRRCRRSVKPFFFRERMFSASLFMIDQPSFWGTRRHSWGATGFNSEEDDLPVHAGLLAVPAQIYTSAAYSSDLK